MNFGELSIKLKDFFDLSFLPHIGMGRKVSPVYIVNPVPEIQSNEIVSQAITQNVWYTVLDTTTNVRVRRIALYQATADEDFEVRITDDRGSEVVAFTAVAGNVYYIIAHLSYTDYCYSYSTTADDSSFLLESRNVKVEFRKTTAAGANVSSCKVMYSKW